MNGSITQRLAYGLLELTKGLGPKEAEKATDAFARMLKERRLAQLLPKILTAYERLADKDSGTVRAAFSSAEELTPAMRKTAEAALAEAAGTPVRVDWKTDPSLIGGAVIRYGDMLLDASLKGRLERLKRTLADA